MEVKKVETGKENLKLSVIVPVYNVEPYIRRCLDSLIHQTYQNLEIILIDDGSTDGSSEICDEYALIDQRVQVIHKENGGIVSARKVGVMCATGEYATNVDSDDWIEIDAYAAIIKKLEEFHPDMLVTGYKKEYDGFIEEFHGCFDEKFYTKKEFWQKFNKSVDENIFFNQPIDMALWTKAIKTELWKKHQMNCPNTLKKNVDDAVIFPCLLDIDNIYVSSDCFYHYCVRKKSVLWGSFEEDYSNFIRLSHHIICSYEKNKDKAGMNRKFLMYKLFYQLIMDIPEKLISKDGNIIYPSVLPKSNIIIYGKGVFASRLKQRINELKYCNVLDNIDKTDVQKLNMIDVKQCDYIVIAILNATLVKSTIDMLIQMGIERTKIVCIEKNNLTLKDLPIDVQELFDFYK